MQLLTVLVVTQIITALCVTQVITVAIAHLYAQLTVMSVMELAAINVPQPTR